MGRRQHRQAVQRGAGTELLGDPDDRVGHDDAGEEHVGTDAVRQDDQDQQHTDDPVDRREHVGAHDLADGAGGRPRHVVHPARGHPLRDLGAAEPVGQRGGGHDPTTGVAGRDGSRRCSIHASMRSHHPNSHSMRSSSSLGTSSWRTVQ